MAQSNGLMHALEEILEDEITDFGEIECDDPKRMVLYGKIPPSFTLVGTKKFKAITVPADQGELVDRLSNQFSTSLELRGALQGFDKLVFFLPDDDLERNVSLLDSVGYLYGGASGGPTSKLAIQQREEGYLIVVEKKPWKKVDDELVYAASMRMVFPPGVQSREHMHCLDTEVFTYGDKPEFMTVDGEQCSIEIGNPIGVRNGSFHTLKAPPDRFIRVDGKRMPYHENDKMYR